MEKRVYRLEIIVYILSILVVFNIAISLFFGISGRRGNIQSNESNRKDMELPESLDDEAKEGIMNEFVENYNKNDANAIYGMMSEYFRIYTRIEDVDKGIKAMETYFGKIHEFHYTHSDYLGFYEGAHWHNLIYKTKTDSALVDFMISIRTEDDRWELAAFRFSFDKYYHSGNK